MAEFVPQDAVQIGGRLALRCGTVGRDHAAKADTQETPPPGRPKVRMAKSCCCGKISTVTGSSIVTSYFWHSVCFGSAQQIAIPVAVDGRFVRIHANHEVIVFQRRETWSILACSCTRLWATTLYGPRRTPARLVANLPLLRQAATDLETTGVEPAEKVCRTTNACRWYSAPSANRYF